MNTKETFHIEGLAGQKKLQGTIEIKGAKNASLKAIAAAILFDKEVTLENVPDTNDIETISEILRKLGAKVTRNGDKIKIDPTTINSTDIDPELAKGMRASVVLTGPLLARFGRASFPAPGGCVIGARPIDLFIDGYKKMGATITERDNLYIIEAKNGLKPFEFFSPIQSVGVTETLMMAAVLSKGKTLLKNCAMEPEISNVAEWLNECGAKISGVGTTIINIEGTNSKLLSPAGEPNSNYVTIPDRIEAGSFLLLGALCAKELTINNCRPDHMEIVTNLLINSGVSLEISKTSIKISNNTKPNSSFKPFNIRTHEYPGFPTDLQSPLVTFLSQVTGESAVFETIYEGRFKYTEDLLKMGANITIMNPREILIKGPSQFSALPENEELSAHDIRAGFAVVLAALLGTGKFIVNNVHLIDRGYESLENRLQSLGANVTRKSK